MEQDKIEIGSVSSVNPARRELRVVAAHAHEHQLKGLEWVRLAPRGGPEVRYRVASVHSVTGGARIMLSAGVLRDSVAALKGAAVLMLPDELRPSSEQERSLLEVEGFEVFGAAGEPVGAVKEVIRTPAHAVLEIEKAGGGTLLVPAIDEVIAAIDWERERLVVNDLAPYSVDDAD